MLSPCETASYEAVSDDEAASDWDRNRPDRLPTLLFHWQEDAPASRCTGKKMHWQADAAGAVQYSLQKETELRSCTPSAVVPYPTVEVLRTTYKSKQDCPEYYRQRETGLKRYCVPQTEGNRTVRSTADREKQDCRGALSTTDRRDQDCPARDCRGTVLQTEGNKTAQRAVQSTQRCSTTDTRKQDAGTEWATRTPGGRQLRSAPRH